MVYSTTWYIGGVGCVCVCVQGVWSMDMGRGYGGGAWWLSGIDPLVAGSIPREKRVLELARQIRNWFISKKRFHSLGTFQYP